MALQGRSGVLPSAVSQGRGRGVLPSLPVRRSILLTGYPKNRGSWVVCNEVRRDCWVPAQAMSDQPASFLS
jgi:hypothetical protein